MAMLNDLLHAADYSIQTPAKSGGEARRLLIENSFDMIIINTPLPDEFGHELARFATHSSSAGVVLIVKSENADDIAHQTEDDGVMVIARPLSRTFFFQVLKLVSASRKRMISLHNENVKLQRKIEEIRLVDRAKCTLIEVLKFSEPQAHRYIEKQAMDLRCTRKQVAENILKTYEA